jgi:hypothetical protein
MRSQRKKIKFRTTFLMRLWARRDEMGKWVNGIVYMIKRKNERIIYESSDIVVSPGWITMSQISLYYLLLNSAEDIG